MTIVDIFRNPFPPNWTSHRLDAHAIKHLQIYDARQLFFSTEAAFFANVVMYALPSSFFALWFCALISSMPNIWRWIISLRLEPYVLKWIMKAALKSGVVVLILPFPLFIYSTVLYFTWEDKDQVALSIFIVISGVASFLILFCGVFSIVAAQWLGHVERRGVSRAGSGY